MFKPILDQLAKEVSGDIALGFVSEISRYHRIQGSPGLRAAAKYAVEAFRGFGLKAEANDYPADGETYCWSSLMPKEWRCQDAELWLTEPEAERRPLARWSESKFSLIQRSYPTPEGGVEAEVVALDKGEEDAEYGEVDVEGKMVLTDGDVARVYELAVERRGALGLIYSGVRAFPPVRKEGDLDDALQYTSFWWIGDERPCPGFVLSPRRGRWLRRLVERQKKDGKRVKVWLKVDSEFLKGTVENAVAYIPGKTDEEVVVVAHLCHPQPSANDNASGCGAVLEAARALNKLIAKGALPRPKRIIRFTLVPEMLGSYAWLAGNEARIPKMVAALNLDMVGENQALCGGSLIIERTPEATPSFVNALMEAILNEVKGEANNLGGTARYALFKHAVTPFSGGSDHYIYSDPSVGVPCPMLIQWPDKFYHTSFDTIDKVDPEMLRKVALMTATYAYFIANADVEEAIWMAEEVASRYRCGLVETVQKRMTNILNRARTSGEPGKELAEALPKLKRKIDYDLSRGIEAVRSVGRLIGDDPRIKMEVENLIIGLRAVADEERRRMEKSVANYAEMRKIELPKAQKKRLTKLEREAVAIVPRRLHRGPVYMRPWVRKLPPDGRDALWKLGKEHEGSRILSTLALYWADGKRNLLEASKLMELETDQEDLEYLVEYFKLLRRMGVIEFK